ncbi:Uncharacterised protein [Achromobacter sp. 2789STDY5608615]|nr:Uncharacterised protein [Achromobacter sp. 2789STDY5608615]
MPSCTCTASGVPPPLLPTEPDNVHLPSPVLISDWKLRMVPGKVSLEPASPVSVRLLVPPPPLKPPVMIDPGYSVSESSPLAKVRLPLTTAPLRLMKLTLPLPLLPITLLLVPLPAWIVP